MTGSPTSRRTIGDAVGDALPCLVAAAACGLAWAQPAAPGFDLLRTAATLFFLELPLAIVFVFAESWRVPGELLPRGAKLHYIAWPALILGAACWRLFGTEGVLAVAWLAGGFLWRLWRHGEDRRDTGRWLVVRGQEHWVTRTRPDPKSLPGAWIFPMTDSEHLPGLTIFAWFGLVFVLFTGADIPTGGATPAYAAAVGWTDTPIGSIVPAHEALAAGLALFLLRAASAFDDLGPRATVVSIDDDTVLREIVDTVEKRRR